jgi:hypothetical protein
VPTRQLPGNSSLEHLKNQARSLRRQVRAAGPQATAAVRQFHPRFALAADDSPELARAFELTGARTAPPWPRTGTSWTWPAGSATTARSWSPNSTARSSAPGGGDQAGRGQPQMLSQIRY